MQHEIILISDPRVISLPIQENEEPLIDLKTMPELFIDLPIENIKGLSFQMSFARETVARMLVEAQKELPNDYRLMIKEAYRDIEMQKKIFNDYTSFLKKEFPNLSQEELYKKASAYVAPPEIVPPHSTGGAIDLTLMTVDGEEIDMGTKFNADPEESNFSNYTNALVPDEIKERRQILKNAMERVGFVNYPTEWWHWSYGDRYWAFMTGKEVALYGSQNLQKG